MCLHKSYFVPLHQQQQNLIFFFKFSKRMGGLSKQKYLTIHFTKIYRSIENTLKISKGINHYISHNSKSNSRENYDFFHLLLHHMRFAQAIIY